MIGFGLIMIGLSKVRFACICLMNMYYLLNLSIINKVVEYIYFMQFFHVGLVY